MLIRCLATAVDPIVGLYLANPSKHKKIPTGLEIIRSFELRVGRDIYQLYAKRLSQVTEDDDSASLRPITDVQVIATALEEHVPLGYEPLLTTVSGDTISLSNDDIPPVLLCFSRGGKAPIRHLGVVGSDTDDIPPLEHVAIRFTPWARTANLSPGTDESDSFLCVSKGMSYRHDTRKPCIGPCLID